MPATEPGNAAVGDAGEGAGEGAPPTPPLARPPAPQGGTRRDAAQAAVRHNSIEVHVPVLGRLDLPPPDHLAWYAAVGALAVLEVIEWPVAAVLCLGKALSDTHRNKAIEEFGQALDEVA